MTKIIASPAELFELARSRKSAVAIVLPHAYEAVQSLRKMGCQYQFLKAAPSIAGKIALLSLEGGMETDEDLDLFASLAPVCGMKDGRIVNTTGHTLPFNDDEQDLEAPDMPVTEDVDDYVMQRADNEWYYYEFKDSVAQSAVLRYIYGLAVLAAVVKKEVSK
jgi:hypothetical protein|nr:MAG TPA: hypothetical protein [Caudoviricetes sp.]